MIRGSKNPKKPATTSRKSKNLCGCCKVKASNVVNCTLNTRVGRGGEEYLKEMVEQVSSRKGGGARVEVDSMGNLVWIKPAVMGRSYGVGVGRIGRIDEDKPCEFKEVDINKSWHSFKYGI